MWYYTIFISSDIAYWKPSNLNNFNLFSTLNMVYALIGYLNL